MAFTPVSLFTPLADPAEILTVILSVASDAIVDVEPASGVWRSATLPWNDGDRWPLRFNHAADYYREPDWSQQLAGLRHYVTEVSASGDAAAASAVLDALPPFRSAIAVALSCDLDLDLPVGDDLRNGLLFAVAERLGATIFAPPTLRDARGRILLGAGVDGSATAPPLRKHPVSAPAAGAPVVAAAPTVADAESPGGAVAAPIVPDPVVAPDPVIPTGRAPDPAPVAIFSAPAPEAPVPEAPVPEAPAPAAPVPEAPVPEAPAPEAPAPVPFAPEPPTPSPPAGPDGRRVALRALALAAVCSRAFLEQDDPEEVDQERERQRIEQWVLEVDGLDGELEPDEWRILQAGIEMLDDRAGVDAAWRIEGLAVLVWALGRAPLPAYDALADTDALNEAVGYLDGARANELVAAAALAAPDRLAAVKAQARAIHWRLREFRLEPTPIDFLTRATDSLLGDLDVSWCRFVGDDLAIDCGAGDVAIIDADDDVVDQVQSVAYERFLAATWLLEGGTYSTVQARL